MAPALTTVPDRQKGMFDAAPSPVSAQRSSGALDLEFVQGRDGMTVPARLHQEGALKVRLPAAHGGPAQAILINTAGGLTGGDRLRMDVRLSQGAALTAAGQACEKLYKSADGEAIVTTSLTVGPGAVLEWLMQPAILFDRARFSRSLSADVAEDGQLLAVEALVFGRTAMAEQVRSGSVRENWRIRRGGKLIYADALALEGDIQATLNRRFVLDGQAAMASILYVGDDTAGRRDRMRDALEGLDGCTGAASAWNGLLAARLVAADGYALTRGLALLLTRFRDTPLPRPWTI